MTLKEFKDSTHAKAMLIVLSKIYFILLEDTGHTFNINMHTFTTIALSKEEAVGKMYFNRPEFRNRKILRITDEDNNVDYIDPEFEKSINYLNEMFRERQGV